MKVSKNIQYKFFKTLIFIIEKTPSKFLEKTIPFLTFIIWNLDFFRKKVVLKNLEIAFPDWNDKKRVLIAKKVYKNYITYFADMIKSINITKNELNKKVKIIGKNNLEIALNSHKPIIFMTAHFGNWELVPKIIGANYKPMLVLMREFENKDIAKIFQKSRNSFNIQTINKNSSIKEIIKAFKENKALGILIDQHSNSSKAIDVKFFNKEVKFNRGVTILAQKFNAIVVPMFSYKKNNQYYIEFLAPKIFDEEDNIKNFTQWQASTIENMIKRYPSEYYWFHKRFKNIKGIYN